MISSHDALLELKEGNQRFREGRASKTHTHASQTRRAAVAGAQYPFAIVLGCSDSRVPAEIVFDQGLGDLFVIRVAGNIASSSQIGSVEFAVEKFGTPLVVVLGHTGCGAIEATVDHIKSDSRAGSDHLQAIVDRIRPSVEARLDSATRFDMEDLVEQVVRANIRVAVEALRAGSSIVDDKLDTGALMIVGAEYSLQTGVVAFFDEKTGAARDEN